MRSKNIPYREYFFGEIADDEIHGIIAIIGVVLVVWTGFKPAHKQPDAKTKTPKQYGLSKIVCALKMFYARQINKLRDTAGISV